MRHILYFTFKLRSFEHSPFYNSVRLDEFIKLVRRHIMKIDNEKFEAVKSTVLINSTEEIFTLKD